MKTDGLIRALVQDLATPADDAVAVLRRALPLAFGTMAIGWLALAGVRADLMSTGFRAAAMKVTLGVILAVLGLAAAVRLSRPERSQTGSLLPLVAVAATAAIAVAVEITVQGGADWFARLRGHSVLACLVTIPLLALLPMAGALLALRHGATPSPVTVGAMTGIGSAGLAIVVYGLFCTEDSVMFVATWYLLASAIAGLAGAIAGRVALRW